MNIKAYIFKHQIGRDEKTHNTQCQGGTGKVASHPLLVGAFTSTMFL